MSDLKNILREEYTKKARTVTPASLIAMIEDIMEIPASILTEKESKRGTQPRTLTIDLIPTLPITEIGWGSLATPEKGGKEVRTSAGQDLAQFLNNIAPGGDLRAKIEALNEYYKSPVVKEEGLPPGKQISRTISNLVFYKTLTNVITNFNASSAGFAFESFLAVLLDAETGRQIPASAASTIADIVVEKGGRPISLKLYKEGQLKVGGSYKQLVDDLVGAYPVMEYVVVTKDLDGQGLEQQGKLNFYGFNFTTQNFIEILAIKAKEVNLMRLPSVFKSPVEELESRMRESSDLTDFLTVPAATYVNLGPIINSFIETVNNLATARGVDPAKLDIENELKNLYDFETGADINKPDNNQARFGYAPRLPVRRRDTMISQMNLEPEEIQVVKDVIDDAYVKAIKSRKTAGGRGTARKEKFKELSFMTGKQSLKRLMEIKQTASPELFAVAMKSTEGYLGNKQFELAKGDLKKLDSISNTDNLYPYGEFEVGTINIGAQGLQEMLDASIGEVNNAIFEIFSDLKDLSSNLNSYVAGGLEDDKLAVDAKDDAENIATGTEEIRDTDK